MRFLPPPARGPVALVVLLLLPASTGGSAPSVDDANEAWAREALEAGARLQGIELGERIPLVSWDGFRREERLVTPLEFSKLVARAAAGVPLDGLPTEPRDHGSGPIPGENPLVPETPARTRVAAGDLWLLEWAGHCRIDASGPGSPVNVGGAGPPAVYQGATVVAETWTENGLALLRAGAVQGVGPEDAPPYTYNVGTRLAGNAFVLCTSAFKFIQLDGAAVLYSTNG